ncbi:Aldo-keto reductase IolS [Apilactobacillus kunkeei]|uniref:aldo/keto reductase n=1 Tax=Apilactobacillus kunkeei TaxID=148814 RepID=UPI00200B7AC1|nr:aldo/keto reductase [Apilactobacillus kunkeei]MCK8634037.1 aldo/keto reductase [Apilactobacillus kunkeei]CAI2660518.1 Aldo-keto reductase IolS [Apilactobacillus kunkeei]CAI2662928.1 Aldo-keto reductase IolS [Apilactobacillus kunkeei]CAI2663801.1 Aldo-keto reductase IolS [Apilactobacillus kunkeei]CAI2664424.1 Aldo-keto reductase IolS [Apilactobacillus kunkeei]
MVKIGKSNVESTPLGLGTNAVGGNNLFPNLKDETGIQIIKTGLDSGITLLDTAFAYGMGHSEELIGQAIKGYDRSKFVIATKAAQDTSDGDVKINNNPQFLKKSVDDALKRLQTDYIDIFYIHFPDDQTPKDEAVAALNEMKQEGKIKAIGVSNFSLDQIKEANKDGLVDVVEDQYSLLHRDAETEMFDYLRENNISFVPFFPLASGLLTGKYSEVVDFPENDIRHGNPDFTGERFEKIVEKVNNLKPLADKHEITIAQLVLAWYIKNPDVTVVIPGAKRPEQVKSNAKALNVSLSDEEYAQIDNDFKNI